MSTSLHILGEDRRVESRLMDDDDGTVWVRTSHETVSLTLTVEQWDQHIAAAQAARAQLVAQAVAA